MADLQKTVLGLGCSMPILAIVAIALRLHVRTFKKNDLGADDYLIVVALVRS